jgi:transposase InsO family protein
MPESLTNLPPGEATNKENPAESNTPILVDAGNSSDQQVYFLDERKLKLQSFLQDCIENAWKKSKIISEAKERGIGYAYTNILRLLKKYKSEGEAGLARKKRNDFHRSRAFSPEVLLQMQKLFKDDQCAARVYEKTHDWLRKSGSAFVNSATGEELKIINGQLCSIKDGREIISLYTSNYTSGSYIIEDGDELRIGSLRSAETYLKFIRDHFSDSLHIAKYGVEDYRLKRQHAMKINYSHLEPCELISGDNKLVDIIVMSEDGRSVFRPWLSAWYDLGTRRFVYEISKSANSESVANSLVKAILEWGIPKEINHDRGSDYLSNMVKNFAKALSLEKRISKRKLARAKPIESFFNVLDNLLIDLPGATGNKYSEMPERTKKMLLNFTKINNEFDRNIKRLYERNCDFEVALNSDREGRIKSSKNRFMSISEFIQILDEKLELYHNRVHRGLKKDRLGKKVYNVTCDDELIKSMGERVNTPLGRYKYKVKKGFKPVYARPEALAMFTTHFDFRIVMLQKGIAFNNEEYFDPRLKRFAGQRVMIRYTNITSKVLYVFHSESLQKISDKKMITSQILQDLAKPESFVCICEKVDMIDYNDPAYKDKLVLQRQEEKSLKQMTGNSPLSEKGAGGVSGITRMTGNESQISEIKKAEMELIQKNKSVSDGWEDIYDVG